MRRALRRPRVAYQLAFCVLALAFVWLDIAQHVAVAGVLTAVVAAYAGSVIRLALRDAVTVEALDGSEQERLRAEAELGQYEQLVRNAFDAIVSRTPDGTILTWNPAAEALFGYTAEEAVGRSIEIIIPPEHLAAHRARRSEGRASRGPREVVRMTKDGRRIDIELTTGSIRDASGAVRAVSVIARDITAARAAAAALRASEARLREAQRLAHVGSWELDLDTDALSWSDEIYRIFEIDRSQFAASYAAFLDRVHPDDREKVHRAYTDSVANRLPYSIDHRLLMADGRVKHVHEQGETEYDAADVPRRSRGTVQDITDRKLAEEAHARLAAIVEHANDAIIGRTLDGIITSWNTAAERLFGYTAAEAVGRPMTIIASARPRRIAENTALLKRGEVVQPFESLRTTRSGALIPVLSTLSPIKDDAGLVTGVAVIIRDMREHKAAEEQRALAASVFEHAAEGIIVTDAENRILSVNRAFTRITGYEAAEVVGRNPRVLSSGTHSPEFYRAMWGTINASGLWQGEVWDKRKSGELYCQSLSITSIADSSGRTRNYCAIFVDVTARKNAELALLRLNAELEARVADRTRALEHSNDLLREANEELNAFAHSVAHDLRGPVRRVHAYTTMALEALQRPGDAAPRALERIQANAEAMGQLIEDLLRLSRISAQDLEVQPIDLTAIAGDVLDRLREQDPARQVETLVAAGMAVSGDPALVRILLENLAGNAWKFTAAVARPRIEIGRIATAEGTAWYVKDNGPGFDMKQAGRLFRPFTRLHSEAEYQGSGIGLSIVQRIAAKHGGRAWAESEAGGGATFYFTLGSGAGEG